MSAGSQRVSRFWQGAAVASVFLALTLVEVRRALRREREAKPRHVARNLVIAATAGIVMNALEEPLIARITRHRQFNGWRAVLNILLLDYTLYVWHVMTHRVPFLWRFHLPHHIDLDLDASTALRFHFGEMLCTVPYRALQVTAFGVDYRSYSIWQTLVFMSILFHHSNVRLPVEWERRLALFLVTPRMHGIHHDANHDHLNSNWSSGLSIWDRCHGTLKLDVPQDDISIGVPGYLNFEDTRLRRVLTMPFHQPRA